jgi:hypothetical protein
MPSDQTPRQPQALQPDEQLQVGQEGGFAEALTGESGDPIWEPHPVQAEAGRAERARRAVREPEGKLPPGRIIDLEQVQRPAPPLSR